MKRFFRGKESGAVTGYAVGLIVLAVILIGGVLLLKNIGSEQKVDEPVAVESGEFKSDEPETETKTEEETKTENQTTPTENESTNEAAANNTVAATGDTSTYAPEKLTATGPEELLLGLVGLTIVCGTIYTLYEYARSRSKLKAAQLRK